MPDFAMCHDRACPSAETCLRSRLSGTKPDKDQEWWTHRGNRGKDAEDCVFYLSKERLKEYKKKGKVPV